MKIRTDFVTNSSSSSFVLMISFELTDGSEVRFDAEGGVDETGRINYFDREAIVCVSPKQLGTAKNVDELVSLLANGVFDREGEGILYHGPRATRYNPIFASIGGSNKDDFYSGKECDKQVFDKPNPVTVGVWDNENDELKDEVFDPYDFILEIRKKIKSMDQIKKVTITGNEENYVSFNRTYVYDRTTGKYTGKEEGDYFAADGSSGGDLRFRDLLECDIIFEDEED